MGVFTYFVNNRVPQYPTITVLEVANKTGLVYFTHRGSGVFFIAQRNSSLIVVSCVVAKGPAAAMKYMSTRGAESGLSFEDVLLSGTQ